MRYLLVALTATLAATAGLAQEAKKEGKPAKEPAPVGKPSKNHKATVSLSAALRMAEYGREQTSPLALLAAARVIGSTPVRDIEPPKDSETVFTKFDPKKEAMGLIQEALKMAKGDATIKAAADGIQDALAERSRGVIGGPRFIRGRVNTSCDRNDHFYFTFRGGENGMVLVKNINHHGDIDLFVYNQFGRLVATDRRHDAHARVSFYVPRTGRYHVVVHVHTGPRWPLYYALITD